jgi:hypothetical protein
MTIIKIIFTNTYVNCDTNNGVLNKKIENLSFYEVYYKILFKKLTSNVRRHAIMCNCSLVLSLKAPPKTILDLWLLIMCFMFVLEFSMLIFYLIYIVLTDPNVDPYAKRRLPPPGQYERIFFKVIDFISYVIVLMFISGFIVWFVCSDFRHELLYK